MRTTVWYTNPYHSISLSPTPQSGWIATVGFFDDNLGSAIVMLITTVLFTLVAVLMGLVLIRVSERTSWKSALVSHLHVNPCRQPPHTASPFILQVHRLYRGGGGSMQRAQEEWSTGLWKSAPVREAGLNAVAQNLQGPSLPQYPTAVPSYPDNSQWWWLRITSRGRQITGSRSNVQESSSKRHIIEPLQFKFYRRVFYERTGEFYQRASPHVVEDYI